MIYEKLNLCSLLNFLNTQRYKRKNKHKRYINYVMIFVQSVVCYYLQYEKVPNINIYISIEICLNSNNFDDDHNNLQNMKKCINHH